MPAVQNQRLLDLFAEYFLEKIKRIHYGLKDTPLNTPQPVPDVPEFNQRPLTSEEKSKVIYKLKV
jgi:hypothetical protein